MNRTIRSMQRSHLSVITSLDAIADLISEVDPQGGVSNSIRASLQRHTNLLVRRFATHLKLQDDVESLTEYVLRGTPMELETLEAHNQDMCVLLREFAQSVCALSDGEKVSREQWRQIRQQVHAMIEQFDRSSRCEWAFYTGYSTLLSPGAAATE